MTRILIMVALLLGFITGSAQAATVDYKADLGTVHLSTNPKSVTLTTLNFLGGTGHAIVDGYLPADSEITFTYTLISSHSGASLAKSGELFDLGYYHYTKGHGHDKTKYSGFSFTDTHGDHYSHGSKTFHHDRTPTNSLVTTLANISADTGTTTIINDSSSPAFFLSAIDIWKSLFGRVKITYEITSAVPLPAALPMFAAALIGLFAFGIRRKLRPPFAG